MLISIVIPAYNEAQRLFDSLDQLQRQMPFICKEISQDIGWSGNADFEIIVVNDGSQDDTSAIANLYKRHFPNFPLRLIELCANQGKGFAVRAGMLAAVGKYAVFMDMDLSTPLTEIPKVIMLLQQPNVIAIGSRALAGSQIVKRQPMYRELMGRTFNLLVRLLVIDGIHDTQCGFKAFRTYDAKRIFTLLQTPRFGFDVEVLLLAQELGLVIQEVPVIWRNVEQSKVSPLADSWDMFMSLWRMRSQVRQHISLIKQEEGI